ncbi:hypothetical protein SNOG_12713 [Parastagonospora nodorum SN15]|uniref:Uncharacterized protein n=1 Tax=Phaeosphaeria nodorum (strain SN15 / ATCC MYA-4574 / FGSC 10173) TaxID=321614 RepID=Q0U6A1_PHANO|nr:hypothetical protein SNOG_12713 [Parastagonospora nodorum SN15]EAT80011.1 hypothetical protein SNOG_12713 [Parastagonospora nodorum SN15]
MFSGTDCPTSTIQHWTIDVRTALFSQSDERWFTRFEDLTPLLLPHPTSCPVRKREVCQNLPGHFMKKNQAAADMLLSPTRKAQGTTTTSFALRPWINKAATHVSPLIAS